MKLDARLCGIVGDYFLRLSWRGAAISLPSLCATAEESFSRERTAPAPHSVSLLAS